MRFALLSHYPEPEPGALDEEQLAEGMRAMSDYATALQEAGVLVGYDVVQPADAGLTLRAVGGAVTASPGLHAATAATLAGILVVDVADAAAAREWAERDPSLAWGGAVEVRPLATYTVDGAWRPNA